MHYRSSLVYKTEKNRRNDDRLISTAARPSHTCWPPKPTKQSRTFKNKHKNIEMWWAEVVLARLRVREIDQCTTLFETGTHRKIHTSTYGNLINLKSSNHGWNWFQHKRLSPLPQDTSNAISNISRTYINEKDCWNWCEVQNPALLCLWTTITKASSPFG